MRVLLDDVVAFYLGSGDFNGFPVSATFTGSQARAAIGLLKRGLIEAITGRDYLNPHIRPWSTRFSVEDQESSIRSADANGSVVCLYPTSKALSALVDLDRFNGRPYEQMMALGGTTFQAVYFRPDVVEPYREDPRFNFQMGDFGFSFNLSDDFYLDPAESDSERFGLLHGGLAYNGRSAGADELRRAVCVLLCDLSKFTPEMQARWKTYQLPDQDEYMRHPLWWQSQMGSFPSGVGPFSLFFAELELWNQLNESLTGERLFRTTDRPKEFSWILRPSQREFDSFVLQLDKLLSDNLRHDALAELGAPRVDGEGKHLGSLQRLLKVIERYGVSEEQSAAVLSPLKKVRRLRQKPAHSLNDNRQDHKLVQEQIDLFNDVVSAVQALREFWESNPKATGNEGHFLAEVERVPF